MLGYETLQYKTWPTSDVEPLTLKRNVRKLAVKQAILKASPLNTSDQHVTVSSSNYQTRQDVGGIHASTKKPTGSGPSRPEG